MRFLQLLLLFIPLITVGQDLELTSFSELVELEKEELRPIVFFFTADWCRYCKQMEATTFEEQSLIKILNKFFYFIPFNIEEQNDIPFRNKIFKSNQRKYHDLAFALTGEDNPVTPTVLILDQKNEIKFMHQAFLSAKELKAVLSNFTMYTK